MKIVLESGSGTPTDPLKKWTLADDFDNMPIQSKSTGGDQVHQQANLFRSKNTRFFDRKNEWFTMEFTVKRQHNTFNDAEIFILEHVSELPRQGLIVITANAGYSIKTRYLPNCIVKRPKLDSHIGVSTEWSYSLMASSVVVNRPIP